EAHRLASKGIELIGESPRAAWGYHNRAMILCMQDKYKEALDDIENAIKVFPIDAGDSPETYHLLKGGILLQLERYGEARATYLLARKLNPKSFGAAYGVWQAHEGLGNRALCCRLAQDLVRMDGKSVLANVTLARSLAAVGQPADALAASKVAVGLD